LNIKTIGHEIIIVVNYFIIEMVMVTGVDKKFILICDDDHEILVKIIGDEYITEKLDSDRVLHDIMYQV
jgi:hypothetical protein